MRLQVDLKASGYQSDRQIFTMRLQNEVGSTSRASVTSPLTVGQLAARSGVAASALRFYEDRGLLHPSRDAAGYRVYPRADLRRVAFIVAAQRVGLSLDEIREALSALPDGRVPTRADWTVLSAGWAPRIDARIAELERLRDGLLMCIGCGCLSLDRCALANPGDRAAEAGPGPRAWTGLSSGAGS